MATATASTFANAVDCDDIRATIEDWDGTLSTRDDDVPSVRSILHLMVDVVDQQQRTIDALASTLHTRIDNLDVRLYGDGSQVPSQGDIPILQRDSLQLMRAEVERVVGRGRIHCSTDEVPPHRRTTDEQATYAVATS